MRRDRNHDPLLAALLQRHSRRALLRRTVVAGVALPGLAAFLAACGGSSDKTDDTPATADTPAPAQASAVPRATATSGSSPSAVAGQTPVASASGPAIPVTEHPRLWVRAADVERLRSWATDANPLWTGALQPLAEQATADMDAGTLQDGDDGSAGWVGYPNESYAQLFAFMSLIDPDQAARDDYTQRARTLLMRVISEAAKGAAENEPFRDPAFSIRDRSRWWGESFGLTVDWIYPSLSADDKAAIRDVFLRWADEDTHAETTDNNHPEPIGVVNDPALLSDPVRARWALNNYFNAHMRNLALMALAFDPADDPDGALTGQLASVTGAWLYMVDAALRGDARGGLGPEGFEYSPQAVGYTIQTLLALYTAGQNDPTRWGPQVTVEGQPFWDELLPAFLASISPRPVQREESGQVFLPAWYGDGQTYETPDFIGLFGPLGVYAHLTGNASRLETLRWIQKNTPPGGAERFVERVGDLEYRPDAVRYFLLFDPTAPEPSDPRPNQPTEWFAPGLGRLLARTDLGPDAAWFTWMLGWQTVDHRHADGMSFDFYRRGEWLTKERTGYGFNISASDYHNTLALENDKPEHADSDDYRSILWKRGSQWLSDANDPPGGQILALSMTDSYVYGLGDATALYNSAYEGLSQITHASRSIIWLKPDLIITYDRATSQAEGYFKRYWLLLPTQTHVDGNRATMTTAGGQQLFVTTLLPTDAAITSEQSEALEEDREPAVDEPMQYRLKVEATGDPADARFLHVLHGADAAAAPLETQAIASSAGTPYAGALVGATVVLFPVTLGEATQSVTYSAPGATQHVITGLTPNGTYTVSQSGAETTITAGGDQTADAGGVLVVSAGA
jgi:hypothetical protein